MAQVAVIGGGYGGISVAKLLDAICDVVLIERKDQFIHHAAALRAAVNRKWEDAIFMPYDHLLARGKVHQGTVSMVEGNRIHISEQDPIEAEYIVIATGSVYPFPARHANSSTKVSRYQLGQLHEDLAGAKRILIVGGGLVGLEMAGEVKSALPDLEVAVLEQREQILDDPVYLDEFRDLVIKQAKEMGIELVTGDSLAYLPPCQPATLNHFEVHTRAGKRISADMWFQCYGAKPITGFMRSSEYRDIVKADGSIRVRPTLQVVGHDRMYAIGDVTDVPENKRADAARRHARVVVANIATQLDGHEPKYTYEPSINWVVLPLGPAHGASQLVDNRGKIKVVGAAQTADIKGSDLMVSTLRSQLNLP